MKVTPCYLFPVKICDLIMEFPLPTERLKPHTTEKSCNLAKPFFPYYLEEYKCLYMFDPVVDSVRRTHSSCTSA